MAAAIRLAAALLHFTAVQCLLALLVAAKQWLDGQRGGKAVSTFLAVAVPSPKYHCLSAPH